MATKIKAVDKLDDAIVGEFNQTKKLYLDDVLNQKYYFVSLTHDSF